MALRDAVRVIGGRWRGRKLRFEAAADLRPTPDRVRETLFNWLMPAVAGARCLDAFAGSGILGVEASSRGAGFVCSVEASHKRATSLATQLAGWGADPDQLQVVTGIMPTKLTELEGPWDVVFLDPPYQSELLPRTLSALVASDALSPEAWVYAEWDAKQSGLFIGDGQLASIWSAHWHLHRSLRASGVQACLLRRA